MLSSIRSGISCGKEVKLLDRITIYSNDGVTSVTMPRCRPTISTEDVSITATMASGKMVEDLIGTRIAISAKYGYVPAADILTLQRIVREGGFHRVTAPGVDGDIDAKFKITPPSYDVFKYIDGVPMWCNVTLKMTAQEVTRYAGS